MTHGQTSSHLRPAAQAALSQALSAGSNFVILLALARGAGSRAVGRFALAFVVYNAALGLQRALVSDALLARPTSGGADDRVIESLASAGSVLLSVASTVVVLALGLTTSFHQLVPLGAFLPALLLEDHYRFLLFRRGRPGTAAAVDAVWAAASCLAFVPLRAHASPTRAIVVWAAGGLAACVVGAVATRTRLAAARVSLVWWKQHLWRSSRWLALESVLFHLEQQVQAFGLVAVVGSTAFGEWQLAQALLGVTVFVNAGLRLVGVTHLSRHQDDQRTAVRTSLVGAGFTLTATAALWLVAPALVRLLFGPHVTVPRTMILLVGLFLVAAAAATGPLALLRGQQRERAMPLARAVSLLAFTPLAIAAARHSFVSGLAALAAGAVAYTAVVAWAAFGARPVAAAVPVVAGRGAP